MKTRYFHNIITIKYKTDLKTKFNTGKPDEKMTVIRLLFYCVLYRILTPEEAETALKTGLLPDSIMERLRIAELKSKN